MYHNLEIPQKCLDLWQECQSLSKSLLEGCPIKTPDLQVDSANPLDSKSSSVYVVKQGELIEAYDEQLIVIYEKSDLVNADALAQPKLSTYSTDFPALVDEYDGKQLLDNIMADSTRIETWSRYLTCLSQSYQLLACHFSRQDTEYLPEYRQYKKGDVIIEENTEGDEVFTLLNGHAIVMSNGEQVGEIHKNEIFGAIAALTNTPRNASVIANSSCDTLVAKSDDFRYILGTRPDVVHKLVTDMARTIISSNERIIELSKTRDA